MSDSLTHRSQILNSQMDTLAEGYEEQDPSQENITHQAKIFRQQMDQLAPDASSIEPETENITHAAKLFNQAMQYFVDNPPSGGGSDGQIFPLNCYDYVIPTMTMIYNGGEI